MANYVDFHTQLASIMEVLANAAVAEICQLVDDGFSTLRLEISRSQRENLALKSRLRLMEVRLGEPADREPDLPLVVTCTRKDHHFGKNVPSIIERKVESGTLANTVTQQSQLLEQEEVVVKKERQDEPAGCRVLKDHETTPNSSTELLSLSLDAVGEHSLSVEAEIPRVGVSALYEKADFVRAEAQQQVETEVFAEASSLDQCSYPTEENHRAAQGLGPNEMTEETKEEEKHVVDPSDSLSARFSCSKVLDVEAPLIKTLDSVLSLTSTRVKGLCGVAADWTPVKVEAEPSWASTLKTETPLLCVNKNEDLSNSRLSDANSHNIESEPAQLDTSSLDSSSFNELFSSPEVAMSLTASHRHSTDGVTGMKEAQSSSSSSFSFLSSRTSDSLIGSSSNITSSTSRSRNSPSGSRERTFSCQQCARLFTTSRDLVVHQRSHAGERIYHCNICKKPFVHPHQVKAHQRVHTGEKPFSCAQCGKRFSQSNHIKRHMSVHTGEKRYSCSLCGKRFSQACSLKVHQTVHTGERPYSCTKCGKSFSVVGNLARHQSIHTSK